MSSVVRQKQVSPQLSPSSTIAWERISAQIPVETIRDACGWFGLLVETDEGQKLFARREPGNQKSTGDMLVGVTSLTSRTWLRTRIRLLMR